ncbi:FKBP-type peptidyl-prolyl cis-trans isomerase [Mucilaginibacter sp. UR6-11]|uniref:FKBP-type peptidyl-prolyl cis-trans isomerase n=1 Tax=Mucilaginibacter sp. UR6-11 TaxID=1435644 RepID=UPI001E572061|nr:FKBP-type peptidyl-prolyl cis-trans isomerase [Mucilaginibacter sp. UR6-11]MCC8426818.1 FKBP-type peptidyl-prolyl cis-trans isomerase [Mucilaginibacter sp. UR6-11]
MKKNLMFLGLAALGLASCNGGYKKGDNGMLYNIYTDKSGPKIKEGDFVLTNLVIKNDADSVLLSTYDQGRPTPLILPKPQFKGDVFDAIKLLAEGDSASIKVAADSVFKRAPKPPTFKGKYLIYDLKIVKLIPKGTQTDQVFHDNITKYMTGLATADKNAEPAKIKNYIAENKLTVNKTDSGLYYVITKPGVGPLIAKGDTAVINYTGKLLSGKVFDSSIKEVAVKAKLGSLDQRPYTPIRVAVGERKVIPGWDQGLLLLNKGAKATLVIPSSLAYGAAGAGPIAPYTPITFEVEVVDVVHPKPGAVAAPVKK